MSVSRTEARKHPCASLRGFHMPTIKMMQHIRVIIRRKYKTQGNSDKELALLEKQSRPVAAAFSNLFHTPENFPLMHRSRDLDFALHVVEAFVRRRYALSSLIPASVRFNFRFVEQDYAMRNDSQQNPLLQIYSTSKFTAPFTNLQHLLLRPVRRNQFLN